MRYTTSTAMALVCLGARDFKGVTSGTPSTATQVGVSIALTSLTRVGTLATATATAAHRLLDGQEVTIAGADKAAYNGRFRVTVSSATVFTYVMVEDPGVSASGTLTAAYTPHAQWAVIVADAANTNDVSFGPNAQADLWPIAAGTWFEIPVPMGAKVDLTQFWVKSAGAIQNWRILFL